MTPTAAGTLIGLWLALMFMAINRNSQRRRRLQAVERNRAAIMQETTILNSLAPDSAEAVRLRQVIEHRLATYLQPVRANPLTLALHLVAYGALTAFWSTQLANADSSGEAFVCSMGAAFFTALTFAVFWALVRFVIRSARRLRSPAHDPEPQVTP